MVQSGIEVIKRFIDEKQENEFVDFKLKTYGKDLVNSELVKDVVAFANGEAKGDKYIIFGVAEEIGSLGAGTAAAVPACRLPGGCTYGANRRHNIAGL